VSDPSISLVIVLYGKRAVTERGLSSLEQALDGKLGRDVELVLVDNASPDDTGELLDAWEDRATVIRNQVNLNFAGGCNVGARAAAGGVLVFLNNDMEFLPGAIEAVAATAGQDGVGAAGARLLFPDGTIQHAGVLWVANQQGPAMPQHVFHHEAGDLPAAEAVLELDAVTAACLAIRRELFLELGGFDERYRNGLEDMDLCLRVRSRGLRIVYRGDIWMIHHESLTRGVDNSASAHNDALFQARWGQLCGSDDQLAGEAFGGRLTVRNGLPLVPHDWTSGATLSLEGHLRALSAEAAESRALLIALELAGLAPCARDRLPAWLIADLAEHEEACLKLAESRVRSPTALRIEVPVGSYYSAGRRTADVLRLAAAPAHRAHLAGITAVWAATPAVAEAIAALGVPSERVAYLPPLILSPPAGAGGAGVLALLPGHDLETCEDALAQLRSERALRLLPSVLTPDLARLAVELVPHAEMLRPTTCEAVYAGYAADADGVLCLDAADGFDRRALIAAAGGAAVATLAPGPAAEVLGSELVTLRDAGELAKAAAAVVERGQEGRARRSAAVGAACSPAPVGTRLAELVASVAAEADVFAQARTKPVDSS